MSLEEILGRASWPPDARNPSILRDGPSAPSPAPRPLRRRRAVLLAAAVLGSSSSSPASPTGCARAAA
jgi:hypothetical protein